MAIASITQSYIRLLICNALTDGTWSYNWEHCHQLASMTDSTTTWTYTYNADGVRTRKTDGTSTNEYTYKSNILTANGHTYTYGHADWKDLLTAFDGETISYDASGNPTSYYNGTRWDFSWNNGRSLTRAVSGSTSVDYTYDLAGLRTSKTVGDVAHKYFYAGSKLMRETYGSNTLDFFYDASGMPYALKYNGTVYYYVTNLQGDVIQIIDASGGTVASYEYDPYGKVISATGTLAETNPIRYRGYYYDTESGLYYLQSRYYDPELGRFINADAYVSTGQGLLGNNMFAYFRNNPVRRIDISGTADADCLDETDDIGLDHEKAGKLGGGESPISSLPNVGYTYSHPQGGGGVSSSVQVGNVTVTFGHGERHMGNVDISQLESYIANDVVLRPPSPARTTHVRVNY